MAKQVKCEVCNNSRINLVRTADLHAFPAMLAQPRSMQQHRARAARVRYRKEERISCFQAFKINLRQLINTSNSSNGRCPLDDFALVMVRCSLFNFMRIFDQA